MTVRTISKALRFYATRSSTAVYVDASQLSAVRWVGMMIQAEEILDAISDGVAVVDPDLRIIWANPEFQSLADPERRWSAVPVLPGAGPAGDPRPGPVPVHVGGGVEGGGQHRGEDRRRSLPPADGDAGLRRVAAR